MTRRAISTFLVCVVVVSTALVITQLVWGRPPGLGLLLVALPAGVVSGTIIAYRERGRLRRNGMAS